MYGYEALAMNTYHPDKLPPLPEAADKYFEDYTADQMRAYAAAAVAAERERCAKLADSMCMGQPGHTAPHPVFLYRGNVGEVIRAKDTTP